MKRILITGVNGFAASHLARWLLNEGCEVHGTVRVRSDLHKIADMDIKKHLIELSDPFSVSKVLNDVRPDEIYHLAAQSFVKSSWDSPIETYTTNVLGTVNLFEQIRKLDYKPAILVTSTSEVYGMHEGIADENTLPNPNTHYGISKFAQDMIARLYHNAFKMNVVVTRAFNITGGGRADVFADSSFAKQIAQIEKGLKKPVIRHGDLNSARDFVDVNDVVKGYVDALRSEMWGCIFCFGSGTPRKIQELLDTLISLSTKKDEITTEVDPARMRPIDTLTMQGSQEKARTLLGWAPTIEFRDSLKNLLNYWRERL